MSLRFTHRKLQIQQLFFLPLTHPSLSHSLYLFLLRTLSLLLTHSLALSFSLSLANSAPLLLPLSLFLSPSISFSRSLSLSLSLSLSISLYLSPWRLLMPLFSCLYDLRPLCFLSLFHDTWAFSLSYPPLSFSLIICYFPYSLSLSRSLCRNPLFRSH